jgi:WD40 repeat protein
MKRQEKRTIFHGLIALAALAIAFSPAGSILAQTEPEPAPLVEITPDNIQDLELLHWFGQGSLNGTVDQTADGKILAALTSSGVALFNIVNGTQIGFIPVGMGPTALAISPDDTTLAIVVNYPTGELGDFMGLPAYNRKIQLYALPDGEEQTGVIEDLGECANSNIWDIAFTPDGKELVFEKKYGVNDEKDVRKFCVASLAAGKVTRSIDQDADASMAISPNGEYAAAYDKQSDHVSIYSTSDFSLVRELSAPKTDWPELLFSHSGRYIATRNLTADEDGRYSIQIWDIQDGREVYNGKPDLEYSQEMGQYDMVTSFEVSQNGNTIYLGTQSGYVEMIAADTGNVEKQLGQFTWTAYSLTGNSGGITSDEISATVETIQLSPDEKTLIASENLTTYGQSGSIHVFELPTGKEKFSFHGSAAGSENLGIAFSPDSSQIAVAGDRDGKVEVYRTRDSQLVMDLVGHTQVVNEVAFSPDGKLIATGSNDNSVRLWDAQTGKSIRTLSSHQGRVTHIAFSPDSAWLVSGADDNSIRRWNAADGQLLETLELGDENWRVDFLDTLNDNISAVYRVSKYPSPHIGFIKEQVLWNTQSGERKDIGSSKISITQFDSGKEMFSGYSDSERVVGKLQADGSMAIAATFRSPYGNGGLSLAATAPNQKLVVSGNGFGLHAWELSGNELNFVGLVAGSELMPEYGNGYLFSPDGKYLAFSSGGVTYLLGVPAQ